MDEVLERVTKFAAEAHGDQVRKYTSDPYIVHPVRVMKLCSHYSRDIGVLCASLLHDVLEDTPVTGQEILSFLRTVMSHSQAIRTLNIVIELTDIYIKKDYPHLNRGQRKALENKRLKKTSPQAQTIKYADIIDNCNEIKVHDPQFAQVFIKECKWLLRDLNRGNKELYAEALKTVDNSFSNITANSKLRTVKL